MGVGYEITLLNFAKKNMRFTQCLSALDETAENSS